MLNPRGVRVLARACVSMCVCVQQQHSPAAAAPSVAS